MLFTHISPLYTLGMMLDKRQEYEMDMAIQTSRDKPPSSADANITPIVPTTHTSNHTTTHSTLYKNPDQNGGLKYDWHPLTNIHILCSTCNLQSPCAIMNGMRLYVFLQVLQLGITCIQSKTLNVQHACLEKFNISHTLSLYGEDGKCSIFQQRGQRPSCHYLSSTRCREKREAQMERGTSYIKKKKKNPVTS